MRIDENVLEQYGESKQVEFTPFVNENVYFAAAAFLQHRADQKFKHACCMFA